MPDTDKTEHNTIAAALAAAQAEMGSAKKTANNPHFKSKYADLDAVSDAAMPALNKHGIAVVQPLERIAEDWVVVTRFIHGPSSEVLEGPVPLIIGKRDMQGLGSAITYARRYGLMGLAGIAPEDDDGNDAVRGGNNRQPEGPKGPDPRATADRIITAVNKREGNNDDLTALWKAEKAALETLPDDMFAEVKAAFGQAKAPPPPEDFSAAAGEYEGPSQ